MDEEVRSYKGTAVAGHHRALELRGQGKDFFGGYSYMSQGPLPQLWANTQMSAHGLWGQRLMAEMAELQPRGRPEDRRRDAAAGEQSRHARGRERSVRPADPPHHLFLVRQRQAR